MFKRCLMATVDEMFALAAEAEKIGKNYVISPESCSQN